MGVIDLPNAEQSAERVIGRNDEAGQVDEELAADVEEDQEKVDADKSQEL